MYCGSQTLVKYQATTRDAYKLSCRSWGCPDCQPIRHRQLVAQCCAGAPNTILTLTCRVRPGARPEDYAPKLAKAWRLLRLRLIRHYRLHKLPFIAVVERTKAGWPHLHILLRSIWLDRAWISDQMKDLLDSPVVDIRRIDNAGRIGSYVAKYLGKEPHRFAGCKRYWSSQDYDLLKKQWRESHPRLRGGQEVFQRPLYQIAQNWRDLGWSVVYVTFTHVACVCGMLPHPEQPP